MKLLVVFALLAFAARGEDVGPPTVLAPNAAGVIDVVAALEADSPEGLPNPFLVRYHPRDKIREIPLALSALLIGGKPEEAAAVVNGRLLAAGDDFEGLTVAAVGEETIDLRRGGLLLRVPMAERPITLRLP